MKQVFFITFFLLLPSMFFAKNLVNNDLIGIESDTLPKKEKVKTTKIRLGRLINVDILNDGEDIVVRKDKNNTYNYEDSESYGFVTENKKFISNINKRFNPHWAGVALSINSFNGYLFENMPAETEYLKVNTNKSIAFDLNLFQFGLPIVNKRLGLVSGLGFSWNNYQFRNTQVRLHSDSSCLYHTMDTVSKTLKSKLRVSYIKVPLLLEVQIPTSDERIYISAGIEAGLKLGAHTKIKTHDKKKVKNKNDFHIMPYSVNSVVRVGYGSVGIQGTYSLLPLFQKGEGPDIYYYSLGFTFNF